MQSFSKPRRRARACRAICALFVMCASPGSYAAWQFDVNAGFVYDSNLTRAYAPADIRADGAFTLDAAAGSTDTARFSASWALDERSSLNVVYLEERTDATGGVSYRSHSASLMYAWRY